MKAADRQEFCKKLIATLHKHYPDAAAPPSLPVLETFLFGICLENLSVAHAKKCYDRIFTHFHDLNEVRVSSIEELEVLFTEAPDREWRALRVKNLLQHVFESTYSFDYEPLKRKTLEQALKTLHKLKFLSSFVRSYVLQQVLGSHVLPIDDKQLRALAWFDLAAPDQDGEQAGEALKGLIRKAEGPEFCNVMRALATDPKLSVSFAPPANGRKPAEEPPAGVWSRLAYLFPETSGIASKLKSEQQALAATQKAAEAAEKVEKAEKAAADKAEKAAKKAEEAAAKKAAPPPKAEPPKTEAPKASAKTDKPKSSPAKPADKASQARTNHHRDDKKKSPHKPR